MIEPISLIGAGVSVVSGSLNVMNAIKNIKGAGLISARFDEEGNKIDGDKRIEVIKTEDPSRRNDMWWYTVKEIPGYVFNRIPLTSSCVLESAGYAQDNPSVPNARYWRWHGAKELNSLINGSNAAPNVKVDFIVIGYKPKALIKHFTS